MSEAPERTDPFVICEKHEWYSAIDKCPWCIIVALEQERDEWKAMHDDALVKAGEIAAAMQIKLARLREAVREACDELHWDDAATILRRALAE